MGDIMNDMNQKLKTIADRLTLMINDTEINVVIDKQSRTISFLDQVFQIPDSANREEYINSWEKIFNSFNEIKRKRRNNMAEMLFDDEERLGYTQNVSYIKEIIAKKSKEKESSLKKQEEKPKDTIFSYGVKISENDKMNNSDWYYLEESNTPFVILTLQSNGKMDKKFKSYLKKCKAHNLNVGIFIDGTSIVLSEAKKEFTEILNIVEEYAIKGPIIYGVNNKYINEFQDTGETISAKTIKNLFSVVDGCKYIVDGLNTKGYNTILNMDLSTINILVNSHVTTPEELNLIYNVLPGQTKELNDNCQTIEYDPSADYERVKLLRKYVLLNTEVK
jgi:hypothetical protein